MVSSLKELFQGLFIWQSTVLRLGLSKIYDFLVEIGRNLERGVWEETLDIDRWKKAILKSYMLYVSNYDSGEDKLWRLKRLVIAREKVGERGINRQKTEDF